MIFENIVHSKIHIIFFVSENIYFCTYRLYVNLKIMSIFYIQKIGTFVHSKYTYLVIIILGILIKKARRWMLISNDVQRDK